MNKELIIDLVGLVLIGIVVLINQTNHCIFIDPITNKEFNVYIKNNDFKMEDSETSIMSKDGIVYVWTSDGGDGLKFPNSKLNEYGFYNIEDDFIIENLNNCSKTTKEFFSIPESVDFYDPSDGFFGPSINFEYKND